MKFKSILFAALIASITACGGESSVSTTVKSIESLSASLPTINPSLESQSPEGIWFMLGSQVMTSESDEASLTAITDSQQFMLIKENSDSSYSFYACGLQIGLDFEDTHLALDADKLTESGTKDETDIYKETYAVDFNLDNNLRLTGTIKTTDEYKGSTFSYTQHNNVNVSAIKVSNATELNSAEELSIEFNAALNGSSQSLSDFYSPISCLSVSSSSFSGTSLSKKVSVSATTIEILDLQGSEAEFDLATGTWGPEIVHDKMYYSDLSGLRSEGENECDDDEAYCTLTTELIISKDTNEHSISTTVNATNEDNDSLTIDFSVTMK